MLQKALVTTYESPFCEITCGGNNYFSAGFLRFWNFGCELIAAWFNNSKFIYLQNQTITKWLPIQYVFNTLKEAYIL